MRTRWITAFGLLLGLLASGFVGSAALATPPISMTAGWVTDAVDVLSAADEQAVNERLTQLSETSNAGLFVVLVDTFTDPSAAAGWANAVADENGLGPDQYLLAIAVEGGSYYISAHEDGPVDFDRITEIEQSIRPYLRDGDWSGAIGHVADELESPGPNTAASTGWSGVLIFLLIAGAITVIIVLFVRARKKKQGAQPAVPDADDPYAGVSDTDLEHRAGAALVQADDSIRSSREDLGFAIAQFGDAATEPFSQVIGSAQAKVAAAFALKQQLDDDVPDTAEQARAWRIQIVQLCAEADELLEQNVEAFDELRQLEKEAPQALERVRAHRAELQQSLAPAPAAIAELAAVYDDTALTTVAENPAEAEKRLALADGQISEAEQALAAGQRGEAAFAIRTAEEAVLQGLQLVAAITGLGRDLADIEAQAAALIADLEADLAAAAELPDPQGQLAAVAARTRSHLAAARAALSGDARRPQQALATLDEANAQIDTEIARVRDAQQQQARAQQLLQQHILQAQAQVSAGTEFITTRRGAIGATARTRLAEASAALTQAQNLQNTDPAQALQYAGRADTLARQAISAAQNDLSRFGSDGFGGGFGGSRGGGGSDLAGNILGGIIGGILASSGGGGGRSSGGGWRSSGGGRSYRPSSFGGSRSGGRSRSGGGRF